MPARRSCAWWDDLGRPTERAKRTRRCGASLTRRGHSMAGGTVRNGSSTGSKGGAEDGQATSRSVATGRDHTVVRERWAALDQADILTIGREECNASPDRLLTRFLHSLPGEPTGLDDAAPRRTIRTPMHDLWRLAPDVDNGIPIERRSAPAAR